VIIVDTNAIESHHAVMVVTYTTPVADQAMVHAWELEDLAFLAKSPPFKTHS
jgi:hypothetical protein